MREGCSYTYPPLSIARYSFIQLSELEQCRVKKLAQGFNTAAQDLKPGSHSRESEALPLSHCAPRSYPLATSSTHPPVEYTWDDTVSWLEWWHPTPEGARSPSCTHIWGSPLPCQPVLGADSPLSNLAGCNRKHTPKGWANNPGGGFVVTGYWGEINRNSGVT